MSRNPRHGDIFIEEAGGGPVSGNDEWHQRFWIYEYREGEKYGKGFKYSPGGEAFYFFWAYPEKSLLLDPTEESIIFSFKHGTHQFDVPESKLEPCRTAADYIKASNFHYVTEEEIAVNKKIEGIKTLDDVRDNWDMVKKYGCPLDTMELCLHLLHVPVPRMVNGELGLQALQIIELFKAYLPAIEMFLFIAKPPHAD